MTDGYFSFNNDNVIYPIPSGTNSFQLLSYDPTQQTLATFFKALLDSNLQPAFNQAVLACKLNLPNLVLGQTVGELVAYELDETLLTTTNYNFPLLYVHDEGSDFDQTTLVYSSLHRHFTVSWILPPLTPTQYTVLNPFFHLVQEAWLGYGLQGYDPKINTTNVWYTAGVSFGSIEDCIITKYDGTMKDKSGHEMQAYFPCLELRLTLVEENQLPVPQNYPNLFGGVSIQLNLVDGYNPSNPIDNLIDGYVYPALSITATSVASGTEQGGTWLYLTGTGFDSNQLAEVTICGAPAAAYATKSASVLLVITNPAIFGTVGQTGDIVLIDNGGNTYTLPNSFTYTSP